MNAIVATAFGGHAKPVTAHFCIRYGFYVKLTVRKRRECAFAPYSLPYDWDRADSQKLPCVQAASKLPMLAIATTVSSIGMNN
jgi:hypothetical protein